MFLVTAGLVAMVWWGAKAVFEGTVTAGELAQFMIYALMATSSIAGVSDKVARCVMMYTLGAKVLPVDAHVHRLARRLGWTERKRADECHSELEAIIPPERRFTFHVAAILHGRAVCRPRDPRCAECCLRSYCPTAASKTA